MVKSILQRVRVGLEALVVPVVGAQVQPLEELEVRADLQVLVRQAL